MNDYQEPTLPLSLLSPNSVDLLQLAVHYLLGLGVVAANFSRQPELPEHPATDH